jgi:histidinol-phosphate aminotransferase
VAERERMASRLAGAGWDLAPSQANFVWLPTADAADLALRLERAGVVARAFPGRGVRLSVGAPEDNDRALAALGAGGTGR